MKTNFLWATITVKNIETSLLFYQGLLGLTIMRRFMPNPGLELCFLTDSNGIEIELLEHKTNDHDIKMSDANASSNPTLGFKVENLDEALKNCEDNNIKILNGPFEGSGVKFFFVQDPDGIAIQFVQN